jgi:ATP-dependent helicase HrpB
VVALPIDACLPSVRDHVRGGRNVVVVSPPGSGKTTRVPAALLSVVSGEILVLEPRRLAARMAARRVAAERGERLGDTVGYQVRFEDISGPRTRLRFMTEGVLTRRLLGDPQLQGVSAVVLDEFHERHLEGDVALAMLRRLQTSVRKDLRLLVMSATLDAAPAAAYLGAAPVVESQGRIFDVAIEYSAYSEKPIEEQVPGALQRLLHDRGGSSGHVLVFLPGAAEIRRTTRACQGVAAKAGFIVLPLHGDLSPEEQDRAVTPCDQRKLILSTNVAESSVTIEGVSAVIDSGLARIATDSPWTGLPSLTVSRISKAAAAQRAGRAGRTGPGRAIRLYTADDFHRRAAQETPEIERRELSQVVLDLRVGAGLSCGDLEWFEPPPREAVAAAEELLARLGGPSEWREMARYPMHPRLARLLIEAQRHGAGHDGAAITALLSAGDRLTGKHHAGPSDLLAMLDGEWSPRAKMVLGQITTQIRSQIRNAPKPVSPHQKEQALLQAILAAFPDRVARRRRAPSQAGGGQSRELMLASGAAELAESSVVVETKSELLVAVDIEERRERALPLVRLASAIEPEWLIDLFADRVTESNTVEWRRDGARVESRSALLYDGLTIQETRTGAADPVAAAKLLAAQAWEAGFARFDDAEAIEAFLGRVRFAAAHSAIPRLGDDDLRAALESLCEGLRSFADLTAAARGGGLLEALSRRLPERDRRLLKDVAPEEIRLPEGRQVKVNYPEGQPPWIESRLQDFFGQRETPRVARGQVPVVVKLLAPNRRPVQTTTDLAGFWSRLYPEVRRELSRRYPKHPWPENPLTAAPPAPRFSGTKGR